MYYYLKKKKGMKGVNEFFFFCVVLKRNLYLYLIFYLIFFIIKYILNREFLGNILSSLLENKKKYEFILSFGYSIYKILIIYYYNFDNLVNYIFIFYVRLIIRIIAKLDMLEGLKVSKDGSNLWVLLWYKKNISF